MPKCFPFGFFSGRYSLATYKVPNEFRRLYEEQFRRHSKGKDFLTRSEAAEILDPSITGLNDLQLSYIWDFMDSDRNGKFKMTEVVWAMYLLHQPPNDKSSTNNEPINITQPPPSSSKPERASCCSGQGSPFSESGSLTQRLLTAVITSKPNVKWTDIAGLTSAKQELQEALLFPLRFPHLYRGPRKPRRGIILYGPPGTGKSYLAKAVATEVDYTLFSISSSDVTSKWMGESKALVRQLFAMAREKKPAIIFIDEIDALISNRDSGAASSESTARMKTEFLVQMDGLGHSNDGVLVLAATNLPWRLDPAVRRRFQKRIHIPLPDEAARRELFRILMGKLAQLEGGRWRSWRDARRGFREVMLLLLWRMH